MQTKEELEKFYEQEDPWDYTKTEDDYRRRRIIVALANLYAGGAETVLDLGCGEGFITKELPGERKFGIEISDRAVSRWPEGITRLYRPQGGYDVVLASGVLYGQYDYEKLRQWIKESAQDILITCHYDKMGEAHDKFDFEQIFYAEFPYRQGKQILRVYRV